MSPHVHRDYVYLHDDCGDYHWRQMIIHMIIADSQGVKW